MMNEPVNMITLVKDLPSRPRGRACIVLTHAYGGQKEWAMELARQTDSGHLDLLELFDEDRNLSSQIGRYTVPRLFEFLKTHYEELKHSSFIIHHFEHGVPQGHMGRPIECR